MKVSSVRSPGPACVFVPSFGERSIYSGIKEKREKKKVKNGGRRKKRSQQGRRNRSCGVIDVLGW